MINPIKLTVVALLSAGALAMPAEAAANDVANVQATADVGSTADAARGPWGYGYGRDDDDWRRRHRGWRHRDWDRYGGYDHGYGRGYKRDVAAVDAATDVASTEDAARGPWGYGYGRDDDDEWRRRHHRGWKHRDWDRYGGYGRGYKRDVAAADAATAENAAATTAEAAAPAADANTAEDARRPWGYGRRGGWGRRYGGWGGYYNPGYYAPSLPYFPPVVPTLGYGYGW